MAGFLFDFEEFLGEQTEIVADEKKYSLWQKSGDLYAPITSAKLVDKLQPGMYKIDKDYNCTIIKIKSDDIHEFKDSIHTKILKDVEKFWSSEENFKNASILHKRGILLEGTPGTGKSTLITQIIDSIIQKGGIVFNISNVNDLIRTLGFYQDVLRKIEPTTPVVTIIEDIDKVYNQIEPELLDFLDGKRSINHSLTILTTNNSSRLSSALLRPSRVDKRYVINLPNKEAREEYFKFKNISEELISKYVEASENMNISQLKELFISTIVLENTFEESLDSLKNTPSLENYLETDQQLGLT